MSLEMKYFVLKPCGNDPYAEASRHAMQAYSNSIRQHDMELSDSLHEWVMRERKALEVPRG